MNKKIKIVDFLNEAISPHKLIIIDTNILLDLFPPLSTKVQSRQQENCGDALKLIIENKLEIVITTAVISEYINRYLRIKFDQNKYKYSEDYKHIYRASPDYKKDLQEASDTLEEFLYHMDVKVIVKSIDGNEGTEIVHDILEKMKTNPIDFTDAILVKLALDNSAAILTQDNDFQEVDEIITIYKL